MHLRCALTFGAAMLAAACGREDASRFQGYVEGDYVRIAAPVGGRLQALSVQRGAQVAAGAPLFALDPEPERQAVDEASAHLQWAQAQLKRNEELRAKGWVSAEQLDAARTERDRTKPQLAQAQWQLAQKTIAAPVAGLVEDTYYRVGEWVPPGAPVVSLLPPENRLVRFFVPEGIVARLKPGGAVTVHRDNAADVAATIRYVAPRAEFTPPVIYSRESRAKLMYMIEARPAAGDATALNPGQPVDVTLAP